MATLTVTQTTDFRPPPLEVGIDRLIFDDPDPTTVTATFAPNQFGGSLISHALAITGGPAVDHIRVLAPVQDGITFSAADWTFTNWGANDLVTLTGTDGDDSITGSSAADSITGGAKNDTLRGLDGNDRLDGGDSSAFGFSHLDGGAGDDTMTGGNGRDQYYVDSLGDVIVETGTSLWDSVQASIDYSIAALTSIENLFLSGPAAIGTGNAGDNRLGSASVATLYGMDGNDTISGAPAGSTLVGGGGDDYYELTNRLSTVVEEIDGGDDRVSFISETDETFVLADNVESLLIEGIGTAIGNASDNYISINNYDWENPWTVAGGDGSDTYVFSNDYDAPTIIEEAGAAAGTADKVRITNWESPQDYTLPDNVENATIAGKWVSVDGNESDNLIEANGDVSSDVWGGGGNDTIYGGGSQVYLSGGGGNDHLVNSGRGVLIAGDGDDTMQSGTANDQHYGGSGNDLSEAGDGQNSIFGGDGNDTLRSGLGHDTLDGGDGNDRIESGDGQDRLTGGVGDDTLLGGAGGDTYVDPDGSDFIYEEEAGGIDTVETYASFSLEGREFIENLRLAGSDGVSGEGSAIANRITGNSGANLLKGWAGDDTIAGGLGADSLRGGDGQDDLEGGDGDDKIFGEIGGDRLRGNGGLDTLRGGDGADALAGDDGDDSLSGDSGDDQAFGGEGADLVDGGEGDDVLRGDNGADTLFGGTGDDELRGQAGADSMNGGGGSDRYFVDNAGDIVVETIAGLASGGNDTVFSQIDFVLGANLEVLRLQGTQGISATGNQLANRLVGNSGANLLSGLAGNDVLEGSNGADTLAGGLGNDTLTGGGQADVFCFATVNAGVDRILDFSKNGDRFDLSGGSFSALTTAPNGDAVLTHSGGTIRVQAPPTLSLAQWNALVIDSGGARPASVLPAEPSDGAFTAHAAELAALLATARNNFAFLGHTDFLFD